MAQRLLLALMVLWCLGAVGWYLLGDSAEEAPSALEEPAATAEDSAPEGPSLAARPPPADGALKSPASDAGSVPEWIRLAESLHIPDVQERFLAWLREDPSRILAFLRFHAAHPGGVVRPYRLYYSGLQRFFQPVSAELGFLLPTLRAQLGQPASKSGILISLLAVLSVMETADGETHTELHALIREASTPGPARVLAADALLASLGPTPAVLSSVEAILGLPAPTHRVRRELLLLMESIRKLGERGRPLTPALLKMMPSIRRFWGVEAEIIKTLVAVSPEDRQVRLLLVRSLEAWNQSTRRLAEDLLSLRGEVGRARLLALLEEADGRARVAGINALLARGHPPEELAPLLMPALTDKNPDVRRKAVSLLGKVGRDVREILPALRELLAADQQDRWLTGVQALGALSTVAGDRDAVLQLLFVAVRLPSSRVRKVAVQSLLMFDEHTERIIPLLADLLDDTEAGVRREAVDGLGELSAHDEVAEAQLRRALGDSDESVRALAQYWLSGDEDSDD